MAKIRISKKGDSIIVVKDNIEIDISTERMSQSEIEQLVKASLNKLLKTDNQEKKT